MRNGQLDANEVDTSEFLCNGDNSNLSYSSYVSLISQSGTDDPQSDIVRDSLGLTVDLTRDAPGQYVGTLDNPVIIGKTVIFFTTPTTHTGVRGELIGDNQVRIELQNGINVFADNFSNLSFELREYE